jgi:predicted transposase YbfD/YdcC
VKHKLVDVLIIVLLAVLANNDTWWEIEIFARSHEQFLRKLLGLENGVPTDDTYRIVISHIDLNFVYGSVIRLLINKIDCAIERYTSGPILEEPDIISFDGKCSRSSGRKETREKEGAKPLFTLSAYSSNLGMCLDQAFIDEKSNEIPEMPLLVKKMNVSGAIVTCDALNTQPNTAAAIIGGGGMYTMPVKGNRKTLHGDLLEYFDEQRRNELERNSGLMQTYKIVVEEEHGGTAIREYYISKDISWLYKSNEWAGLSAIGMARRIFRPNKPGASITCDDRYYILGGIDEIEDFSRSSRFHWNVENKLHWQLDYTMKDDVNKTMSGGGAEGLQLIKKAALAVLNVARALYPPYVSLNYIRSSICQGFETEILRVLSILDIDSLMKANRREFNMDTK